MDNTKYNLTEVCSNTQLYCFKKMHISNLVMIVQSHMLIIKLKNASE